MPKVDLHTHSVASPDGGLRLADYREALAEGRLDVIAITDHDRIDFALAAREALGESIIIGEEIMTSQGEIIGLYLDRRVEPGQTPWQTVMAIREQGGLVYIPHPFERVRKGLQADELEAIASDVDIIEIYNGRVMQRSAARRAREWAKQQAKAMAASSDSHGRHGWGRTYSEVSGLPSRATLVEQLQRARYASTSVGLAGRLYPRVNTLAKKLGRHG